MEGPRPGHDASVHSGAPEPTSTGPVTPSATPVASSSGKRHDEPLYLLCAGVGKRVVTDRDGVERRCLLARMPAHEMALNTSEA
jgi:hypothetical protein